MTARSLIQALNRWERAIRVVNAKRKTGRLTPEADAVARVARKYGYRQLSGAGTGQSTYRGRSNFWHPSGRHGTIIVRRDGSWSHAGAPVAHDEQWTPGEADLPAVSGTSPEELENHLEQFHGERGHGGHGPYRGLPDILD